MSLGRVLQLASVAVAIALPGAATASESAPTLGGIGSTLRVAAPTRSPQRPTGIHRLGSSWSTASRYERYGYLIVGRSAARAAAAQRGVSLVYQSGTCVNGKWDAGVPYPVALANGWLLKNASNALVTNLSYPDCYIADVGNPAYQADWARRVGRYLMSIRADGVYIDDVLGDIAAATRAYPAKYPNQASWEDAMASFVESVGSALKSRGLYVLVNAHKWIAGNTRSDDGSLEAAWWRRLAPSVSGLHSEYWLQDPTNTSRLRGLGPEWWNHWDGWQRLVRVAQSNGADFFGYTEGSITNTRAMRYGKASFLLDWDGGGGGFIYSATDTADPWNAAWTTDIGRPTAAKVSLGGGVWMRRFERGTVIVNPTPSTLTVTVDGTARTIDAADALIVGA